MNGKTTFAIDQTDHIIGSQHSVSPFGRMVVHPSYYRSADFLARYQSSYRARISRGHLSNCFPHSQQGFLFSTFTVVHSRLDAPLLTLRLWFGPDPSDV